MATITGYTDVAVAVAVAVALKHPNPPTKTVDTQSVLKRQIWENSDLDATKSSVRVFNKHLAQKKPIRNISRSLEMVSNM